MFEADILKVRSFLILTGYCQKVNVWHVLGVIKASEAA